jgi:hypothetical protein
MQPIHERRSLESLGRCPKRARPGEQWGRGVEDSNAIRHDPRRPRKPPGKQCGVSRRGLSDRVIVVRVGEPGASPRQPREAALELRPEPIQVVPAKLIDSDQNYQ